MCNKKYTALIILLLFGLLTMAATPIYANNNVLITSVDQRLELTEEQKSELANIHQEIFKNKKELITKYVEFGIISKENGDRIISRLEKRQEMLKEKGFIPGWFKIKNKCKCE